MRTDGVQEDAPISSPASAQTVARFTPAELTGQSVLTPRLPCREIPIHLAGNPQHSIAQTEDSSPVSMLRPSQPDVDLLPLDTCEQVDRLPRSACFHALGSTPRGRSVNERHQGLPRLAEASRLAGEVECSRHCVWCRELERAPELGLGRAIGSRPSQIGLEKAQRKESWRKLSGRRPVDVGEPALVARRIPALQLHLHLDALTVAQLESEGMRAVGGAARDLEP